MFGFKKKVTVEEQVLPIQKKEEVAVQSMRSIIEEIHATFYTEQERILEYAEQKNSLATDKQALLDKCERLRNLGFTDTAEVKEAKVEIERLSKLEVENLKKEKIGKATRYFMQKYPLYKFITEDSVKEVCAKYNLIYGTADKYIGTIPDKNVAEMEAFKIDEIDECYEKFTTYLRFGYDTISSGYCNHLTKVERSFGTIRYSVEKMSLEICAPRTDFSLKDHEIKDFKISKIEILDPVVLQPVHYEGDKFFLVITAWGLEAEDENVLHQIKN